MNDDFLYRDVSFFGRRVFRLGLATNYGIEGEDLEWALQEGINYIFWTPNARRVKSSLKAALNRDRESFILASGPTTGYFGGSIKRACDRLLRALGTEYLDVFQLFWLGRTSIWNSSTIDALVSLKESGKVRAIGISINRWEPWNGVATVRSGFVYAVQVIYNIFDQNRFKADIRNEYKDQDEQEN